MAEFSTSDPTPTTTAKARITLAAGLQLPRRLVLLPLAWALSGVVIGVLMAALANLLPGGEPADWTVSVAQKRPVVEIVAERLPNTLLLLGTALVFALVLALALALLAVLAHRLESSTGPLGSVLKGLGRLLSFSLAALPAWGLGVVLVYFLVFRLQLFPAVGMVSTTGADAGTLADRLQHLVLPVVTLAAFPAVATAQAIAREVTLPRTKGRFRLWLLGLLRALGTLLGQIGGLIGAAVMVETVFAWPGLGRAVIEGILRKDYPLVLGMLTTLSLFILVGRLLAELFRWLERLVREEPLHTELSPWRQNARKAYVVIALVLLLIPLGLAVAGAFSNPAAVLATNPANRNQGPTDGYPLGTDTQGRDIQARVLRGAMVSLAAAVGGAVLAVVVGGGYGALAGYLASQRTLLAESLADVLLWPADVALFLPAVPAALIAAQLLPPSAGAPTDIIWLPLLATVAIALLPRTIRAGQALWLGQSPEQKSAPLDGLGALVLGAAMFGMGLVVTLDYVGLGISPPTPALGSQLREGMNLLQINPLALLAPLVVLWVCTVTFYFAADALLGYFQDKGAMARLNE
jgi:ABC-type dipeptide/oligopeptide/nickel transport system permease component/ABC-type dipeptide/oligopeptide/nickel transport system permease subunit